MESNTNEKNEDKNFEKQEQSVKGRKKRTFKGCLFSIVKIVIAIFVLLFIIGIVFGDDEEDKSASQENITQQVVDETEEDSEDIQTTEEEKDSSETEENTEEIEHILPKQEYLSEIIVDEALVQVRDSIQSSGETLNVPEEIIMDVINTGKDLNGAGYLTTWTMENADYKTISRKPLSYNGQKIVALVDNRLGGNGLNYNGEDSSFEFYFGDPNAASLTFTGYASDVIDVTGNTVLPVDYDYIIGIGTIYYDNSSAELMLDRAVFIMVDSSDIDMSKYKTFIAE